MHIKTSTHVLSLAEDHIYNLRKIGVLGDDSWLEARKGEAYNRHLQVKLHDNALHLSFEGQPIGLVPIVNTAQVKSIVEFVQYWNLNVGPTDLTTTKTIELVRDWPQLLGSRELRVRCVSWNCAGLLGETGLKVETWMRLIGSEQEAVKSDVIVLSFQESDNLNRSVKANPITLQRCADLSSRYLYKSHKLVSSVQLLGLMTLTFVRHELVPLVSHVRTDTSSTGFLRMWGNKGAVLTRLNLLRDEILGGGLELSIVNCHLSAGEGITQLGRRRWELKEISSKFDIPGLAGSSRHIEDLDREVDNDSISSVSEEESETLAPSQTPSTLSDVGSPLDTQPPHNVVSSETVSETDTLKPAGPENDDSNSELDEDVHMASSRYLIVMGDLNYRVLMSESEVLKKVKKQQWDGLLSRDSLSLERQNGEVFREFEEGAILFAPTYKYEIGSTRLKGRVPSYTDRILFRTKCEHTVESYVSLTDLKSSDHRPVALTTRLTVPNVIDTDKRAVVLSRAMKLSDDAENNVRPKLSVDPQQVTLKGPPLSLQAHYITIRNEGMRPVHWIIENAQEQMSDQGEEDLSKEKTATSERERGIEREHTQQAPHSIADVNQVCVTPPSGEVSLNRPTSGVRIEARIDISPRDYILLVRPDGHHDGGVHQYVFVHIEPTRSYLGATLKSMPQTDNIPDPVRKCVEYLWDRRVPDMFLRRPDLSIFQQVLHWIDHDEPFDLEVLKAADQIIPNTSIYAVSHVLMALFKYLPEQLMGPGPKRKGATKDWAGVTNYVCRFISRTTDNDYEEQNLDVWATLLYDRNDKRAGATEKRAYLRSMLIIAQQKQSLAQAKVPVKEVAPEPLEQPTNNDVPPSDHSDEPVGQPGELAESLASAPTPSIENTTEPKHPLSSDPVDNASNDHEEPDTPSSSSK